MHKSKVIWRENRSYVLQYFISNRESTPIVIEGLQRIFSNEKVILFNQNMKIETKDDALKFIENSTFCGEDNETNHDYYLFDNINNKLIGIIKLLTPKLIIEVYPMVNIVLHKNETEKFINTTWAIEYYLDPTYWGHGLMSSFIKSIIQVLHLEGVTHVFALTNHDNHESIGLLEKLAFQQDDFYKDRQNQALWFKET